MIVRLPADTKRHRCDYPKLLLKFECNYFFLILKMTVNILHIQRTWAKGTMSELMGTRNENIIDKVDCHLWTVSVDTGATREAPDLGLIKQQGPGLDGAKQSVLWSGSSWEAEFDFQVPLAQWACSFSLLLNEGKPDFWVLGLQGPIRLH